MSGLADETRYSILCPASEVTLGNHGYLSLKIIYGVNL